MGGSTRVEERREIQNYRTSMKTMLKALDDSPAVKIYRQYVDAIGLGYEVRTSPERTFPAYAGSVNLQYASVPR